MQIVFFMDPHFFYYPAEIKVLCESPHNQTIKMEIVP